MNTTISRLANFDLESLKGTISGTLQTAQKIAGGAGEAAKQVQTVTQKTAEAVKEAQTVAGEAAEKVKDIFKNPFN